MRNGRRVDEWGSSQFGDDGDCAAGAEAGATDDAGDADDADEADEADEAADAAADAAASSPGS